MGRSDESNEQRRAYQRERYHRKKAEDPAWYERQIQRQAEARAIESDAVKQRKRTYMAAWKAAHPDYKAPSHEPAKRSAWREQAKARDPEKWRRSERAIRLKSKYGVTIDAYEAMLAAQGDLCAICRQPERMRIKGTLAMLAVDHDAASGRVRGLLCVNCNMLIGGAHHEPDILTAAIAYLQRPV